MKRPRPTSRTVEDWPFSLVGNDAENLRDAINNQLPAGDLDAEFANAAIGWIDAAGRKWLMGDDWLALNDLGIAHRAFGVAQQLGNPDARAALRASILSENGRLGAESRLRNDPTQVAKAQARKLWFSHDSPSGLPEYEAWRSSIPRERRSDASFARFICAKFGLLDVDNVRGWIRDWRKEVGG